MGFIGTYSNGKADGEFWIGMKGNGYLHGNLEFNLIMAESQIVLCSNFRNFEYGKQQCDWK